MYWLDHATGNEILSYTIRQLPISLIQAPHESRDSPYSEETSRNYQNCCNIFHTFNCHIILLQQICVSLETCNCSDISSYHLKGSEIYQTSD